MDTLHLFEQIPTPVFLLNAKRQVLEANERGKQLQDELSLHGLDQAYLNKVFAEHIPEHFDNVQTFEIDFPELKSPSKPLTLMLKVRCLSKDQPYRFICSTYDMSPYKENASLSSIRENRYRKLIENNFDAISIENEEGVITYMSQSVKSITGHEPAAVIGRKATDFIHPADLPEAEAQTAQLLAKKIDHFRHKHRLRTTQGNYVWVDAVISDHRDTAGIGGLLTNFKNIDAEQRAKQELELSHQRFRLASLASRDVVWEWDLTEDRIHRSENYDKFFGAQPQQSDQNLQSWRQLIHPEDRERVFKSLEILITSRETYWNQEYRHQRLDGSYAYVEDHAYVVRNEQQKALRIIGAMRDITEQHEYEQRLQAEQEKFKNLFDHSFIGIGMVSMENGKWCDFNQALLNILGYQEGELKNLSYKDITPEEYRESDQQQLEQLLSEHTYGPYQKEFIRRDQKRVKVIMSGFLSEGADGEKVGWNHIMDISPIEKTSEALKAAEERFRTYIENSSDVFVILNGEGKYHYVSPNITQLLGFEAKEMLGTDNLDYMHPEDIATVGAVFEKALQNIGSPERSQFRARHKEGHYIWVDVNGRFLDTDEGLMAYLTVRPKDLEGVPHEHLRKLSLVADHTNSAVLITDAEERIEWVNDSFKDFSGYSLDEVIGKRPKDFLYGPESQERYEKLIKEGLASGHPFRAETVNYHKNGSKYWIETQVTPVFDKGGKLINYIAIENNITERREEQEALKESLSYAREQNRRLQEFAHVIGHNFRSHSNNINSLVKELRLAEDEESKELVMSYMEKTAANLNEALNSLSEMIQLQDDKELPVKELAINDYVVRNMHVLKKDLREKKGQIHNELPGNLRIPFYSAYLDSILFNLLSNAIRYSSPARDLEITLRHRESEKYLEIQVIDNGLGIDLEKHGEQVFTMYKTFHQHPESKGLGLYLTFNQLQALGGAIEVESEVDKGSTFTVKFPKELKKHLKTP